ncbi:MAG: MBL fold metallo-hydrolase [Dehalococcoidia bacterium]|nr:MBL fold metallo-hydrolase [Dehalococcoidia bacterium]
MKLTIIYDNEIHQEGLQADWGFSCLIEAENTPMILFDTGASGTILLQNMKKLGIDPKAIPEVFISHYHWDHTGGLQDFLRESKDARIFVPGSYKVSGAKNVTEVKTPLQLHENIFSTGELKGIEQSMIVRTKSGLVVIAGCSHPGVENILRAASDIGKVSALIGGLHGFREFDLLEELNLICPCHCTQYQEEIRHRYPEKCLAGGAGKVIEI